MKITKGVFKVVSVEGNCNNDIIKVWYLLWRNNFMLLLSSRDVNVLLHYCTLHTSPCNQFRLCNLHCLSLECELFLGIIKSGVRPRWLSQWTKLSEIPPLGIPVLISFLTLLSSEFNGHTPRPRLIDWLADVCCKCLVIMFSIKKCLEFSMIKDRDLGNYILSRTHPAIYFIEPKSVGVRTN